MSGEFHPPAFPGLPGPSEYVSGASGDPSGLTDRERWLILKLAVLNLQRQTGCDELTAAAALDHFADLGDVVTEAISRTSTSRSPAPCISTARVTGSGGQRSKQSARLI